MTNSASTSNTRLGPLSRRVPVFLVTARVTASCRRLCAEKMIQAPTLMNENGTTAGISNAYLVCCAYFYLCIVRKLQWDELQLVVHFLQALAVSPELVRAELAPELYRAMVESCIVSLRPEFGNGVEENERVKWGARSYKARLMYHQVISYGESPLLMKDLDEKSQEIRNSKACSTSSSNSYEHAHKLRQLRVHQNENADEFVRSSRILHDEQQPETTIALSKEPEPLNITSFSEILASDLEFWNSVNDEQDEQQPTWQNFQISRNRNEVLTNHKSTEEITFCGETSYRIEQAEIVEKVISGNQSAIEEIRKKGLNLRDQANALKRDVHEAAVLIHLINPSPNEIKTLEIMPTLVKIICGSSRYKFGIKSLNVTPSLASNSLL